MARCWVVCERSMHSRSVAVSALLQHLWRSASVWQLISDFMCCWQPALGLLPSLQRAGEPCRARVGGLWMKSMEKAGCFTWMPLCCCTCSLSMPGAGRHECVQRQHSPHTAAGFTHALIWHAAPANCPKCLLGGCQSLPAFTSPLLQLPNAQHAAALQNCSAAELIGSCGMHASSPCEAAIAKLPATCLM